MLQWWFIEHRLKAAFFYGLHNFGQQQFELSFELQQKKKKHECISKHLTSVISNNVFELANYRIIKHNFENNLPPFRALRCAALSWALLQRLSVRNMILIRTFLFLYSSHCATLFWFPVSGLLYVSKKGKRCKAVRDLVNLLFAAFGPLPLTTISASISFYPALHRLCKHMCEFH